MKLTEIFETKLRKADRAGFFPYYKENDKIYVYLMIPSDAAYGGTSPQIAKGKVDSGETHQGSAIREAEEELGLMRDNLKEVSLLISDEVEGLDGIYTMKIFYGEIKNPKDFNKPHYETGWAGWIEINQALQKIRKNQFKYLQLLKNKLN